MELAIGRGHTAAMFMQIPSKRQVLRTSVQAPNNACTTNFNSWAVGNVEMRHRATFCIAVSRSHYNNSPVLKVHSKSGDLHNFVAIESHYDLE